MALVFVFLSACADAASVPSEKLSRIKAGMTREEVLATLGPQREEAYGSTGFLIYAADRWSHTALLEFIPVAIVEGRVTGTSRTLYVAVVQAYTR